MSAAAVPAPAGSDGPAFRRGERSYYLGDDPDHPLAEVLWSVLPDGRIAIEHVEVSVELQGRGIARRLVDRVVAWAREENRKIVPVCPYAESVLTGSDAYRDVLG